MTEQYKAKMYGKAGMSVEEKKVKNKNETKKMKIKYTLRWSCEKRKAPTGAEMHSGKFGKCEKDLKEDEEVEIQNNRT